MKKLSIITVNYFSSGLIKKLSDSIRSEESIKWIVVDNSNDQSEFEKLKKIKNIAKLVDAKKNLGFGKANNLGFKYADSEFVMFLNPDTTIDSLNIDSLIGFMKENVEVGMVGPKILNYDGSVQISAFKNSPSLWSHILDYTPVLKMILNKLGINSNPMAFQPQPTKTIDNAQSILGACMLMTSKEFIEVGKFDKKFFLYREETDLAHRITKKGKKVAYFPKTSIKHQSGGASKNNFYAELNKEYVKSSYIYLSKWHSLLYVWIAWMIGLLGTLFTSIVLGILGLFIIKDNFRLLKISWRCFRCSLRHILHPLALGYYYRYI